MKVRKKPITVDAREVTAESEIVETRNGTTMAQKGDYVLTDPETGDTWPVERSFFEKYYVVVG